MAVLALFALLFGILSRIGPLSELRRRCEDEQLHGPAVPHPHVISFAQKLNGAVVTEQVSLTERIRLRIIHVHSATGDAAVAVSATGYSTLDVQNFTFAQQKTQSFDIPSSSSELS